MTLKKRIATAIATGAVLLQALAPMTYAYTLTVTGNGTGSYNDVNVDVDNNVDVDQDNYADIDNNIDVDGSTGGNDANGNVGGNVLVETGNAVANVTVENAANYNQATVNPCCENNVDATISGNGSYSKNDIDLNFDNDVDVNQDNDAYIDNDVDVDGSTGRNDANNNVGGNVKIKTGSTDATVTVKNMANANTATVGGGNGEGGEVSAWITGNGSDSNNDINLNFDNNVDLDQDNYADVDNNVDVEGKTGKNDANGNVGGDVEVLTGDANATVEVDTLVNFNAADVEACGCLEDLEAKIASNGSNSKNDIDFNTDSDLDVNQENDAYVDNDVDVEDKTGKNDANDNVGAAGSDPTVDTGDADSTVEAKTAANANVYGDFEFDFDLGDLLDWLGL